jgi:teichuronic acid biosynthesis glycosyltransferase TuaG
MRDFDGRLQLGTPAISVIMPVYNAARWLPETLHSFSQQTFKDFELIAVDDGSTDDSLEVLHNSTEGMNVTILSSGRRSGGAAKPLNVGHIAAKADLIVYADSDDLVTPDRLQVIWDTWLSMHRKDCLFFSDYSEIDSSGRVLSESKLSEYSAIRGTFKESKQDVAHVMSPADACDALLVGNFTRPCAVAITKGLYVAVGAYDETLKNAQDYDYYLRAAQSFPFVHIDRVLAKYRNTPGSISTRPASDRMPSLLRVLAKVDDKAISTKGRKLVREWKYTCYMTLGYDLSGRASLRGSLSAYGKAYKVKAGWDPLIGMAGAILKRIGVKKHAG